jgi:voltage-gated sodium channel
MSENKKQTAWQLKIENFVAHQWIQTGIVVLIIINALLLGMETSESIMDIYGPELHLLDHAILGIFICEIALLMLARGLNFFKDPWCVFDFVVIAIALIPASESLAVLRSLRVLRVLRLINKVQSMRKVVKGLLGSLASLGSVIGLMLIVFYVSAVISTNLFAKEFPDWFGNLGASFFTLFQIMTLESWSEGIARPVMDKFPYSWIFFLSFIMIATFTVINLFIAAIVDSFSSASHEEREEKTRLLKESKFQEDEKRQQQIINEELDSIRLELQEIKSLIQKLR